MTESTQGPAAKKSGEQKLASPYGPLLWILAPLILIVGYGLIFKF